MSNNWIYGTKKGKLDKSSLNKYDKNSRICTEALTEVLISYMC